MEGEFILALYRERRCKKVSLVLCYLNLYIKLVIQLSQQTTNQNRTHVQNHSFPKETPFCTFKKRASYSIEAAVVMSMMIFIMALFLWVMRAETTEYLVKKSLYETACELSCIGDFEVTEKLDENKVLKHLAIARCKQKLVKEKKMIRFIDGGLLGLDFGKSEIDDAYISLECRYRLVPITPMFSDSLFRIREKVRVRRYIGWNPKMEREEAYVYVTRNGKAYHRSETCPYLKLSIREVSRSSVNGRRAKDGSKYKKCSCVKKGMTRVYITDYGNRFHGDLNCTDLRRHIRRIHIKEAQKDYHSCPKCGGR